MNAFSVDRQEEGCVARGLGAGGRGAGVDPRAPCLAHCARTRSGPAPRARRDGLRVPRASRRRAVRAGGRPQAARRRPGRRGGPGALPHGAPDPRLPDPPPHRPPPRRRRHGRRPSVVRDGAGRRAVDRRALRRGADGGRRTHPPLPRRVRGGALRPPQPDRAPRPEAVQHPRPAGRDGEAPRLRDRQAARPRRLSPGDRADADGRSCPDARVGLARAGARRSDHDVERRLPARLDPLPPALRTPPPVARQRHAGRGAPSRHDAATATTLRGGRDDGRGAGRATAPRVPRPRRSPGFGPPPRSASGGGCAGTWTTSC